ncbi:uncharacterized protein A1O9_05324 [Exophiala aquamarina CBS 119918]|uniref:SCP domain-containing protein n=1 Tax=Exophiala aquamarina CBS 119918 TaxID=1182545 RepID=A0A072PCB9_9EURO|nr:uncharacterized protein A1O9_05324 [Exophiala aquamarina CBS 119918]KEF57407.1 hypothetical protein A1O9_05324 [Exophiala aquamarina CBS 119918]
MKTSYLFSTLGAITLVAAAPALEPMKISERQDADNCPYQYYIDIMLGVLNVHRANHSVADLAWNQTLATAAQYTTDNGPVLVHDNAGTGWGQNQYAWYSSDPSDPRLTNQAAIDSWYNGEFRNYDAYGEASLLTDGEFSPPPAIPGGVYGHLTQVIWKDTATVGCGTSGRLTDDGIQGYFTVCNFYPPGNWVTSPTSWVDNVLAPLGNDVVENVCGAIHFVPPSPDS